MLALTCSSSRHNSTRRKGSRKGVAGNRRQSSVPPCPIGLSIGRRDLRQVAPPSLPRVDDSSIVDVDRTPWGSVRLDALIPLGVAHWIVQRLSGADLKAFLSRAVIDAAPAGKQLDSADAELSAPMSFEAVLPVGVLTSLCDRLSTPEAMEMFVSRAVVTATRALAEKGGAF
jgi:hypothetical protein